MATQTLTRVDPISYGKVLAVLMAIIYFIIGIIMTLFMGVLGSMASAVPGANATAFAGLGIIGGLLITVFLVVGGAIGGFIMGLVIAFLYNLVAGWIGGVKIDLE